MKKTSLIVLALTALTTQLSFAEGTSVSATENAQVRAQAFQNLTPEQQEAAIASAKQTGQATVQQKQENWNSMSPEQQQAQKDSAKSNMESKMSGMKTQMQSRMGGMNGGMHGGVNADVNVGGPGAMMRQRMGR